MECLAGAWNIVPKLWDCSAKHTAYIRDLEDNLASLRSESLKLKDLTEDVRTKVREAEGQEKRVRNQVNGWLERVGAVENEVDEILHKGEQELGKKCFGSCCPKNCLSSYKIGNNVLKMIPRVAKLTEEGKFDAVADELPPPLVDEQPMDNVVVGFESKFEEVWQSVQNNDSLVIGLKGMGGVGKTTLLKQLNNKFLKTTHAYDMIIWIVVSKPTNLEKIRGELRNKLNILDQTWDSKSEDEKSLKIFEKLKNKKFVVLLDNMWEKLQLSAVGIPLPSIDSPGSKIVFTTRLGEVCQFMAADKVIPVGCLPQDQALNLFYSKLGGEDILRSDPEMQRLVTDFASDCQGLPLALITLGHAMRGKMNASQWEEAKRALEKQPSTFPGIECGVFSKLIFSYESLPNPMVKKCFEYCSLYPKDHIALEEELIKLWLAEGFIEEYVSLYDAFIEGRQIMDSLEQSCLLETAGERSFVYEEPVKVKMHDMIRDMALWIACERGKKKNKFCVQVARGGHNVFTVAPNAEKISLWGTGITTESLEKMSFCSNMTTLIIQDTRVEELRGEIIHSMNVLKVLDLSGNLDLMRLPIGNGCLEVLEYLNIVRTRVRFPAEGPQWKKLRFWTVDDALVIPRGIISNLCSLQMFEQVSIITEKVDIGIDRRLMEREILQELEGLKHIMDIRLVLYSTAAWIEILLVSPKLQRCTSRLVLKPVDSPMLDFGTEALANHLERCTTRLVVETLFVESLTFRFCQMSEIKLGNDLCEVSFFRCHEIRNLSSLFYVPNLCILEVSECESMEELIGEEMRRFINESLFSCLTSLTLENSPKLRSICPQDALPFPSLEFMGVWKCGSLGKLPLDSNNERTTPRKFYIKGEREWWDGLEWDSQATKHAFTPKFIPTEGKFDVVAHQLPPPLVDEQLMDNVEVGFESKFEEVWRSVQSNDSHVIGLVGMGGVGKTTLLKYLNNQFLKATHKYDMVIRIAVSYPTILGRIQDSIRSKLNIPNYMWENLSEDYKNSLIFSKLKKKKFVILLDDIWEGLKLSEMEGLELSEMGIPRPSMDNMSKIVFTTRSREVCWSMSADKVISVGCLPPNQAFGLFYSKLGDNVLKSHPEMQGLITDVANECEGLPLALSIIGRAMRHKTDARQWKAAKRMLEKCRSIFSKLVFSYDSLPNSMIKKCFEYCSLYAEDHNIVEEEVIKLWVAERFIDEYDSMDEAFFQGRQIIESLKQACLLETGERSFLNRGEEQTVKMHDMIRDMALWIGERGGKKNKFCIQVARDIVAITPNAEKISLQGRDITTEFLARMPLCPNLTTLIIRDTRVEELPGEIVHSVNVLDLSNNGDLRRLPIENDCLKNLEYLNIAWTEIRLLEKVPQWKKLRFLIVDSRMIIPRKIISSLCSLQMFEQVYVMEDSDIEVDRRLMEMEMLQELEGLKNIMDIRLALNSATGIQKLLDSPKLQSCTTRLAVNQVDSPMLDFGTRTLTNHLERLQVEYCRMSAIRLGRPSLGSKLYEVSFFCCDGVRDLSSLIYVPNLSILRVVECFSISELIGEEETCISNVGTSLFSSLTSINLENLPKLRSICPQDSLPFPSLKFIEVFKCSNLVKLPLDSNTARTTRPELKIRGEECWWDRLEWDSQATKDAFTPKFNC